MDALLAKTEFPQLFTILANAGYRVLAPAIEQEVVRHCEVQSLEFHLLLKRFCEM